jgi:hypothetical protein
MIANITAFPQVCGVISATGLKRQDNEVIAIELRGRPLHSCSTRAVDAKAGDFHGIRECLYFEMGKS